eukprot:scaffold40901_cov46-Phaeocystis_antarctica.AAC.2
MGAAIVCLDGQQAVESAALEAASSSTRGSGWAPSVGRPLPGNAELSRVARRALRGGAGAVLGHCEGSTQLLDAEGQQQAEREGEVREGEALPLRALHRLGKQVQQPTAKHDADREHVAEREEAERAWVRVRARVEAVDRPRPGSAELPGAARRALRRHRSRAGALPRRRFGHAAARSESMRWKIHGSATPSAATARVTTAEPSLNRRSAAAPLITACCGPSSGYVQPCQERAREADR